MLIEIIMMLICRFRYILTSTLRQIKQTLAWVRSAANPAARIPTCIQPLPFSKTKGHGTSVRSAPIHCRPCYKSHTTHNTAKCSSVGSGTKRFVPLTSSPHSTCFAVGVLAKRKRSVTIDNCTSLRRAQVKTSTPDDGRTGEKICTYNLEPISSPAPLPSLNTAAPGHCTSGIDGATKCWDGCKKKMKAGMPLTGAGQKKCEQCKEAADKHALEKAVCQQPHPPQPCALDFRSFLERIVTIPPVKLEQQPLR